MYLPLPKYYRGCCCVCLCGSTRENMVLLNNLAKCIRLEFVCIFRWVDAKEQISLLALTRRCFRFAFAFYGWSLQMLCCKFNKDKTIENEVLKINHTSLSTGRGKMCTQRSGGGNGGDGNKMFEMMTVHSMAFSMKWERFYALEQIHFDCSK